jgi:hypothetical protein
MADLPADTIAARDFSLVSPLTSLTVRRLRKEPPVLLKMSEEMRETDFL